MRVQERRELLARQLRAAIANCQQQLAIASQPRSGHAEIQALKVQLASLERQLRRVQEGKYDNIKIG